MIFIISVIFDEIVSDDDVIFDVEMRAVDLGRTFWQFFLRKIVIILHFVSFELCWRKRVYSCLGQVDARLSKLNSISRLDIFYLRLVHEE